jgi:hypothetical protein
VVKVFARAHKTFMSGDWCLVFDFDDRDKSCSLNVSFAAEGGVCNIIHGAARWEILSISAPASPRKETYSNSRRVRHPLFCRCLRQTACFSFVPPIR